MNMVNKMKHNTELGSRIATVHSGTALFTCDAGCGSSEIRKYLIENDQKNKSVIKPFLVGDDLNSHPFQQASRFVIDFCCENPLAWKFLSCC